MKQFYKRRFPSFAGTLNELDPSTEMPDHHVVLAENFPVSEDGKSREKRRGYSQTGGDYNFALAIKGISHLEDPNGVLRRVVITNKKIFLEKAVGNDFEQLYYQATDSLRVKKPVTYESGRPIIVGFDKNYYIDVDTPASPVAHQVGIDAPTSGISAENGSAGNLTGDYKYLVTFYKSGNFPAESNPSLESEQLPGGVLTDGGFENWTTPTDLTDWAEAIGGTSTVNRESVTKLYGSYAVRLDVDGGGNWARVYQDVTLSISKTYRFRFCWKNSAADKKIIVMIRDTGGNIYLDGNQEWQTSSQNAVEEGSTDWKEKFIDFEPHPDYTSYRVQFIGGGLAASTSIYIDGASLRPIEAISVSAKKINLYNIPTSSDPQVTARRIYRTKAGGEIYYWLDDINNNTANTYTDNIPDASLGHHSQISYDRGVPPVADDVEVWDDRVWFMVSSENKVYFTNTGEEYEMADENFIPFESREPENLTAIKAFGGSLYVFKPNSVFRLNKVGDSYYELEKMPFKAGCDSHGSVVATENMMIWKSKTGVELFNGYNILKPALSRYIKNTFSEIDVSKLIEVFGELNVKKNQYWLTLPAPATGGKSMVLNLTTNTWDVYTFADDLTAFYNFIDSNGAIQWLSGTFTGELMLHSDTDYTDDGTAITARFKTKWFPVDDDEGAWNVLREMRVKYILTQAGGESRYLTLKVYSNFSSSADITTNLAGIVMGDKTRRDILRVIHAGVKGAHICFEFYNSDSNTGDLKVIGLDGYFLRKYRKTSVYAA